MQVSWALVVCVLFAVAVAPPAGARPLSRVRALDRSAEAALNRGLSSSPHFRRLVAEIEASDLIVHVMIAISLPGSVDGATQLISAGRDDRYVRILLSSDVQRGHRTTILAHELQHACEIARSGARDAAAVRRLYETIGRVVESQSETYETTAAIEAGLQVWSELQPRSQSASNGSSEHQ
jgi:hypothetical protein